MSAKAIHAALLAAVGHFVQHYRTDLDHDLRLMENNPGVPFIHWTRKHGTWMTLLPPFDNPYWPNEGEEIPYLFGHATREQIADQIVNGAKYCARNEETLACYHFDGKRLAKVTADKSLEIVEDHRRHLLYHWKRKTQPTSVAA